jgi:hypothetical protein
MLIDNYATNLDVSGENSMRTWNKLFSSFYNLQPSIYTSKIQPISNWQVRNGLCFTFITWKTKKLRRFDNITAHWSMPVRQFLHNLQTCGAFLAAFTSKKRWMTIEKVYSAIGH